MQIAILDVTEGKVEATIAVTEMLQELVHYFSQDGCGGVHTPPHARLLLWALASLLGARTIVECGYDAAYTTEALACVSGAHVTGLDNLSEYPKTEQWAQQRAAMYPNVTLQQESALTYLSSLPANSVDFCFVDDNHRASHVTLEAREIRRVLRPGGLVAFHDTTVHRLWDVMQAELSGWEKVNLPCVSPLVQADFGLGLARKPA